MEGIKINITKEEFLEKYSFESNVLEENNINWETLIDIYNDFESYKETLEEYANLISGLLRKQDKVHTVRTRIKDSEHLIAKLIRKVPERKEKYNNDFQFTVENYKDEITDLIGVRVIHIFKEDWLSIHNFILGNWFVKESQANIREGDNQENYTNFGVQINSRKTGYRSVHYLIEFIPTNQKITAEVQVRTIFEEGYGEIDHQLSYPNSNVPNVLTLNLLMLNRLAGSADEMASAVKLIKNEWANMQFSLSEKDQEIEKLKSKINLLDIQQEQKDSLVEDLDKVKNNNKLKSIYIDTSILNELGSYTGSLKFNDPIAKGLASSVGSLKFNDSIAKGLASSVGSLKFDDSITKGLASSVGSIKFDDPIAKGLASSVGSLKFDDSITKGLASSVGSIKFDDPITKGPASSVGSIKFDDSITKGLNSSVGSLKFDDPITKGPASSVGSIKFDDSITKGLASSVGSIKFDDSITKGLASSGSSLKVGNSITKDVTLEVSNNSEEKDK